VLTVSWELSSMKRVYGPSIRPSKEKGRRDAVGTGTPECVNRGCCKQGTADGKSSLARSEPARRDRCCNGYSVRGRRRLPSEGLGAGQQHVETEAIAIAHPADYRAACDFG
jgi:hypothetical protein